MTTSPAEAPADAALLAEVLSRLEARYDLDRWHWRPKTPALDIAVGAILVQHTAWSNVELALAKLRDARVFDLETLRAMPEEELATLIRPAGTPAVKAHRLKALLDLAAGHGGFDALLSLPLAEARALLLATSGIGPETADCILLYGGNRLTMVHDAYTARLFGRIGAGPANARYDVWQSWLVENLPADVHVYQRFHAGIVVHCKETCRARPRYVECPLRDICAFGQAALR